MSIRRKLIAVALLPLIATAVLVAVTVTSQTVRAQRASSAAQAVEYRSLVTDAAIAVGTERLESVRARDITESAAAVDALVGESADRPQSIESAFTRVRALLIKARTGPAEEAVDNYNLATEDLLATAASIEVSFPNGDMAANGSAVADVALLIESADKAWVEFAQVGSGALGGREISEVATLFSLAEVARSEVRNEGSGETAQVIEDTLRVTDAMSDYQVSAVDALFSTNTRLVTAGDGLAAAADYRERWIGAYERTSTNLDFEVSNDSSIAVRNQVLAAIGGLVGMLLLGLFALIIRRSISDPLGQLLSDTDEFVGEAVPEMIRLMHRAKAGQKLEVPPLVEQRSKDEIGDLAGSFNDLGMTAHRLASDYTQIRDNTNSTLLAFGERLARLLDDLLGGINELETDDQNIAQLAKLGELDHLASVIRRNAQSLVVVGGDYDEKPWSSPTSLEEVVTASVSSVLGYDRVDRSRIEPGFLRGSSVADVQHIVAELIENALKNSAATERVSVAGFWNDESYVLVVEDHGRGMNAGEISLNTSRIKELRRPDQGPATRLGLAVVGRLSRQHGIDVNLTAKDKGVNAVLTMPPEIVEKHDQSKVPASLAGLPEARTQRTDAQLPALVANAVLPKVQPDLAVDPFGSDEDLEPVNDPASVDVTRETRKLPAPPPMPAALRRVINPPNADPEQPERRSDDEPSDEPAQESQAPSFFAIPPALPPRTQPEPSRTPPEVPELVAEPPRTILSTEKAAVSPELASAIEALEGLGD